MDRLFIEIKTQISQCDFLNFATASHDKALSWLNAKGNCVAPLILSGNPKFSCAVLAQLLRANTTAGDTGWAPRWGG